MNWLRKKKSTLDKRVVVITGAAGGMGQALSKRFLDGGARVALTDLDGEAVASQALELSSCGHDCMGLQLDVTDETTCAEVMSAVKERFGRLDVLINNAGITHRSLFSVTDIRVFRRVMDVNLFGSLNCTKAALDYLKKTRGRIVVISSVAGFAPLIGRTGYAASKHALHGLFNSLRAELRYCGIGVTLICPGFTATNIDINALGFDGQPARHPQTKVGAPASPESVADAVFQAIERRRRLVVLSGVGRLAWYMNILLPALYERIMIRNLKEELAIRSHRSEREEL
jgi:NAD(P)-dependent dehydrogenase (short-subunit alcohol dehydrogenase family)